jgi:2,4-dienoyl-CoA reductase-like NADH-dependent reductase (Old Yellow Enzyme family)
MNAALRSGALDVVGLARLLAIDPDAPAALLQGRDSPQQVRPIKTGLKAVDRMGVMEVCGTSASSGASPEASRHAPTKAGCRPS